MMPPIFIFLMKRKPRLPKGAPELLAQNEQSFQNNHSNKPERLFTFASGGWILLVSIVISVAGVALTLANKRTIRGNGRDLATYGYNLQTTLIPKEKLTPAGFGRDAIISLTNPEAMTIQSFTDRVAKARKKMFVANEQDRAKLIVNSDRIVSVTIDGQSRAYPISFLTPHEVINDTLNGKAIAITYSPLCDSIVVFDRNVDGRTPEFGVSGLLVNSNLVLFDKQTHPQDESLWSQLQFRAIAGPAAEKQLALSRVPAVVTTWGEWKEQHPDGTIMIGPEQFWNQYRSRPYNTYKISHELKFPVAPLWQPRDGIDLKTPIVAIPDGDKWIVRKAEQVTAFPDNAIASYMFAWYAMWPDSKVE